MPFRAFDDSDKEWGTRRYEKSLAVLMPFRAFDDSDHNEGDV